MDFGVENLLITLKRGKIGTRLPGTVEDLWEVTNALLIGYAVIVHRLHAWVSGRYTYPTHTGDGRYTYHAGGRASSCVAALTREWPLASRFTIYSSRL